MLTTSAWQHLCWYWLKKTPTLSSTVHLSLPVVTENTHQHVVYLLWRDSQSASDLSAAFLASPHSFLFELFLSCRAICSFNMFLLLVVSICLFSQPWTLQNILSHFSFISLYFRMNEEQNFMKYDLLLWIMLRIILMPRYRLGHKMTWWINWLTLLW